MSDETLAHDTPPQPREVTPTETALLWFGLLGGAAAWAVHFLLVYLLSEIDCASVRLSFTLAGLPALSFFGYLLTLLAVVTALAAAVVARGQVADEPEPERAERTRFMARTGVWMNLLFAIGIVASALPFLFLRACGA